MTVSLPRYLSATKIFELANGGVFSNPPIKIHGDGFHPDPTVTGGFIAADVAVASHLNHVQRPIIPYPGPPPGDKNGKPHARIICEVANHQSIGQLRSNCQNCGISVPTELGRETSNTYLTGCNSPNIPAFQINIPVNQVFWDPLTIPAAAGHVPAVPTAIALINN
ncbi:unnamed protein product [Rhizophagus irregularis]|nr:unnamed protein product [Rhizophagus irregularis]